MPSRTTSARGASAAGLVRRIRPSLPPCPPVEHLPRRIGMASVAGGFIDQMEEHPAQIVALGPTLDR